MHVLPISLLSSTSFDWVRDINTIFNPFVANSFAYSRPIPSVDPVTTEIKKKYY